MDRVWLSCVTGGALVSVFVWRLFASNTMQEQFNRALFKFGYLLYANTRCGRWINDRYIRKAQAKYGNSGHSDIHSFTYGNLQVWPIPCSFDNYAYVIADSKTNDVVIVDAGDGSTILRFLEEHSMVPKAILTTHRHWDHCGGNELLKKRYSSLAVYGSAVDKANGVTQSLVHEQQVKAGSLEFTAYSAPGHTRGHMVYQLMGQAYGSDSDCLFTGDLLFMGGCGKLFEGSAEEMLSSLDLLCTLPGNTLVWPGHEYAVNNLVWAFTVDPENLVLQEKLTWTRDKRSERIPTCPSTLEEEKQYNLFLRTGDVDLLKRLGILPRPEDSNSTTQDADEQLVVTDAQRVRAFAKIREKKDRTP